MLDFLNNLLSIVCLVLGFGLMVFVHELGHFLAAKWVGIKVEQFAIGMGPAIFCWRRGLGFMRGSSARRLQQLEEQGHDLSGIGETEYRLSWIPLGGYVKMLGQDDLDPAASSNDPRAYTSRPAGQRMLVISAGVIMNVIFAALLFMALFLIGYRVQPPVVGSVLPFSPAQAAGLRAGDRIERFNGQRQYAFNQLQLNVALVRGGQPVPMTVVRDGKRLDLTIIPRKPSADSKSFYAVGVSPIRELRGLDPRRYRALSSAEGGGLDPSAAVLPGDTIIAIDGVEVAPSDYRVLDEKVQTSGGRPVLLTVRDAAGKVRQVKAPVEFQRFFGDMPFNILGMQPQPKIAAVMNDSPMKGRLLPGDVIAGLYINDEASVNISLERVQSLIQDAGARGLRVDFLVDRNGQRQRIEGVVPSVNIGGGRLGVSIGLEMNVRRPVVAAIMEGSAAARAKLPPGSVIQRVNDADVGDWFDLHRLLKEAAGAVSLTFVELDGTTGRPREDAVPQTVRLEPDEQERAQLSAIRYEHSLLLRERIEPRKTSNPLLAAWWGVTETRDLLLQFYVTLRRVSSGDISARNFMGPIGIVHSGSFFALKGWDWLIWFLAMLSANLAVVNFLPIPIMDGGWFLFLLVEKFSGRPAPPWLQRAAHLVGAVIIASIVILVTYQDIRRLLNLF